MDRFLPTGVGGHGKLPAGGAVEVVGYGYAGLQAGEQICGGRVGVLWENLRLRLNWPTLLSS